MDIQQKKAVVLDALLEHKGIEHILSAASHVLLHPLIEFWILFGLIGD